MAGSSHVATPRTVLAGDRCQKREMWGGERREGGERLAYSSKSYSRTKTEKFGVELLFLQ